MGRRVDEDHKHFIDIVKGKFRKELKRLFRTGDIYRMKGKTHVPVRLPKIDQPHIVYGDPDSGIKRGPGKPGDVIGRDKGKGEGGAGNEEAEGLIVNVDIDTVLDFMAEDLALPDLKPKERNFDDFEIKYTGLSQNGPESLRHNRRTFLQAMKRVAASGEIDKLYTIPGYADPVRLITPIKADKRYRQFRIHEIPSSNAVVFFARDGSISMDEKKCEVVSDMAFWIDRWVRRFYEKVERCYVWHDVTAEETDEEKFYRYRYGGGTKCSSAFRFIAQQFENRFRPEEWNIYVYYFTDGENWPDDNERLWATIKEELPPNVVNSIGVAQVMTTDYDDSVKKFLDDKLADDSKVTNLRTAAIGDGPDLPDEERNKAIHEAIKTLLGSAKSASSK